MAHRILALCRREEIVGVNGLRLPVDVEPYVLPGLTGAFEGEPLLGLRVADAGERYVAVSVACEQDIKANPMSEAK